MHEAEATLEPVLRLLSLGDLARPLAIRTAVRLRVFDRLEHSPSTADALAGALNAQPGATRRLADALCAFGFLSLSQDGVYMLTAMGRCLCERHPLSMRDAFQLSETDVRAWTELEHCARTGGSGFEQAYGQAHRRYRSEHREEDIRMDRAHQAATRLDLLTLSRAYPWAQASTIVDVGGGTGTFLAGILSKFQHLRGILFDLPRMICNAPEVLNSQGVLDRCTLVGGSFFDAVPAGYDHYVLKAVVGGWDDTDCVSILTAVCHAMLPNSRLLIIEPTMGVGDAFSHSNLVQLHSLVLYGGVYRAVEDYQRLTARAGLVIERIIPRSTLPIIEVRKAGAPDPAPPDALRSAR